MSEQYNYKIGDKVICVDNDHYENLTLKKIYIVNKIDPPNRIFILNDSNKFVSYFQWRFEPYNRLNKLNRIL